MLPDHRKCLNHKRIEIEARLLFSSCFTAICSAVGDPHYKTFDNKAYSFQGSCSYIMTRDNNSQFEIQAANLPCGSSGVTCTKSVTIRIMGSKIHLVRNSAIRLNNQTITGTSYSVNGLSMYQRGVYIVVRSDSLGITVLWDGGRY